MRGTRGRCRGSARRRRCFGEVQRRAERRRRWAFRNGIKGIGECNDNLCFSFASKDVCRFLRMASDNSTVNQTIVFASPSGSSFTTARVPIHNLNTEVLDVAFTKTLFEGNYPGGDAGLRRDHRYAEDASPLGEHWSHKYVLDMDGMGYSAKFFALMESESAVLKSTVFEEFWSNWAEPWSVSLSMPLSPFMSSLPAVQQAALHSSL